MQGPHPLPPDLPTLAAGLTEVLRRSGMAEGPVTILDRRPNLYASTSPSEIVTCRLADGGPLRLFCKYSADSGHRAHGHRGGVAYEAEVYGHVLQPLHVTAPTFYGLYPGRAEGEAWLILQYLDGSVHVSKVPDPAAMGQAAGWIGQFHAAQEARLSQAPMPFLNRYDAAYYAGWARRTLLFAGRLSRPFPWLAALCRRFEGLAAGLLALPPTLIHGEYYPKNILVREGRIYPVDWESAALAAGEIDLASLTEGWPEEVVPSCELAYRRARWPAGPPAGFERALDLARLYLQLRWLGDRPDRTAHESSRWRFEQLRSVGERLGVISDWE